jgi:hypothetical protein
MKIIITLSLPLLLFSCAKNEKAKICLGMELGGDYQAQMDSAVKHGLKLSDKQLFYPVKDTVIGLLNPYYGHNSNEQKILAKVLVIFHNVLLPLSPNSTNYTFNDDYTISAENRKTIITLYEEKYGKCTQTYLKDEENGCYVFKHDSSESFEWHSNPLIIRLSIRKKTIGPYHDFYCASVEYKFIQAVEKMYRINSDKIEEKNKKNATNI